MNPYPLRRGQGAWPAAGPRVADLESLRALAADRPDLDVEQPLNDGAAALDAAGGVPERFPCGGRVGRVGDVGEFSSAVRAAQLVFYVREFLLQRLVPDA